MSPNHRAAEPIRARRWRAIVLWLSMALAGTAAAAADGVKTLKRLADPVILKGSALPLLAAKDINRIRVYVFHDGRPNPIPYQIDQRDSSGDWVWTVAYRQSYQVDYERGATPYIRQPWIAGAGMFDDQDPKGQALLDANDQLVFMANDLGDRGSRIHEALQAQQVEEVEITDPENGTRAWAYVAWYPGSPPARSPTRYMEYSAREHLVRSPVYDFHFSDQHMAVIHDLRVHGVPVIDRIRINGEITLGLPFMDSTIKFTEKDIHGHTEGYIAGPVRIIRRNIAHLTLAGGLLETSAVTCDHFYYARYAEVPICLSIHFPVKQVSMTLTTDYRNPPFHNLLMGKIRKPAPGKSGIPALETRVRELGTEWIAFDSKAASIVSLMVVPEPIEGQASARPCLCEVVGETSRSRASAGTPTEAGFLITSTSECPRGEHVLYGTYLISARPYRPGDENAALRMRHDALVTHVLQPAPDR